MIELILGFVFLLFVAIILFVVFIIFSGLSSVNSINKGGIDLIATITEINRNKKRDKDNAVYDDELEIKCEFEYQGKHELKLHYNYKLDASNLKVGDKISVVYDPKKNWISTRENIKSSKFFLLIPLVFILLFFIPSINLEKINIVKITEVSIIFSNVILILAFIFWEYIAIKRIDKNYIKGNYIKIKGTVTDIFVRYSTSTDSNVGINVYSPEVTFKYNGKKIEKVSSLWSSVNKYKRGQEVMVYYDPETDSTYTRGNNTFYIIMVLLGLLFLIPIFKMFL